jgi:hypothetical protein
MMHLSPIEAERVSGMPRETDHSSEGVYPVWGGQSIHKLTIETEIVGERGDDGI